MPLEDIFQWINNQFGWGTYIPPTLPQNKNSAIIDKVHFNNDYQPVRSVGKLKDLKELWDELTAIIPTDEPGRPLWAKDEGPSVARARPRCLPAS